MTIQRRLSHPLWPRTRCWSASDLNRRCVGMRRRAASLSLGGSSMQYSVPRSLCLALVLVVGSLANAQDVGLLHLGALRLQFPSTWSFDFSKRPVEGRGPNGERVLITTETRKDAGTPDGERAAGNAVDGFAKGPMTEIAGKHGMK